MKHSLFFFYFFCHGFVSLSRVNKVALCVAFIAAVVVPATVPTVIVMPKDEHISGYSWIFRIFDGRYSVKLLANGALDDLVLLVLMQPSTIIEVNLIKGFVVRD